MNSWWTGLEHLTRWCHLCSNLPAPFEDTLIPLNTLWFCCTFSDCSGPCGGVAA